jgi:sugar phosphate isomerase/epimerase
MDEIFSRLGSLVRHVRARDAITAHRRTMPAVIGQGSVNWDEFFADLDAAGYRGWITIDPIDLQDRIPAAEAGLAHLRRLMRP